MPTSELYEWAEFFKMKSEEHEKAKKAAESKRGGKGPRKKPRRGES